jgi:hypothetical protein
MASLCKALKIKRWEKWHARCITISVVIVISSNRKVIRGAAAPRFLWQRLARAASRALELAGVKQPAGVVAKPGLSWREGVCRRHHLRGGRQANKA